jgi:hypothetical protein
MEQRSSVKTKASFLRSRKVNLSEPIFLVTDCGRHSMQYSDLSDNILSLVKSAAVKLCYQL